MNPIRAIRERNQRANEAVANKKAEEERLLKEEYKIIVTMDNGVILHRTANAYRFGAGVITAKENAENMAENFAKKGIWQGNSLFSPHRISVIRIEPAGARITCNCPEFLESFSCRHTVSIKT
jgi:hypothetical protein